MNGTRTTRARAALRSAAPPSSAWSRRLPTHATTCRRRYRSCSCLPLNILHIYRLTFILCRARAYALHLPAAPGAVTDSNERCFVFSTATICRLQRDACHYSASPRWRVPTAPTCTAYLMDDISCVCVATLPAAGAPPLRTAPHDIPRTQRTTRLPHIGIYAMPAACCSAYHRSAVEWWITAGAAMIDELPPGMAPRGSAARSPSPSRPLYLLLTPRTASAAWHYPLPSTLPRRWV